MNTLNPGVIDCIKHSLAEIDNLATRARRVLRAAAQPAPGNDADAAVTALNLIDTVCTTVDQAVAAFVADGDNPNRYSDGRPVRTHIDLDAGDHLTYVWHPLADHPANQPHDVGVITTPDGTRKRVFVAAPGVLDSINADPPESGSQA